MEREQEVNVIAPIQYNYTKSNFIISSVYQSTLSENKLMAIMLCKMNEAYIDKEGSIIVSVKASEIRELLNVSGNGLYDSLLKSTKRMMAGNVKSIGIIDPQNKRFSFVPLVTKVEYEKGVFSMRFAPEMEGYLRNLKKQYTLLNIKTMLNFNSIYSFRLYELLKSKCYNYKPNEDTYTIEMSLSELKFELGVIDSEDINVRMLLDITSKDGVPDYDRAATIAKKSKYERFTDFKTNCLEVAVNEINKNTDIVISEYVPKKKGSTKITSIVFTVKKVGAETNSVPEEVDIISQDVYSKTDDFIDLIMQNIDERIKVSQARELAILSDYKIENIIKANNFIREHTYDNYFEEMKRALEFIGPKNRHMTFDEIYSAMIGE